MADLAAAKRYAQAAFDLVRESSGDLATWRAELDDVAGLLAESQLAPYFVDARVPIEERVASAQRVLDVQPLVLNLAKLLVSKGRAGEARAVAQAFGRIADEAQGLEHAHITTAVELSSDQRAAIESRLSSQLGKRVQATASVDPRLLGGVVIRVGDKLIDGSVRTRLQRLKQELAGAR